MAVSYLDYTSPTIQFTYDLSNNLFFKKDARNYINGLSINQLNTLGNVSLLDIFLSTGNVVEPHIHQNATELVYCISGSAVVSIVNPFTKELLNFPIQPGQVANVPQGWWHYEIASVDNTHLLAIFDAPVPEFIGGSDLLRLTPASVFAHTYCLNEAQVKETLAPITQTVVIGPPNDCHAQQVQDKGSARSPYPNHAYFSQPYGSTTYQHPDRPQHQMPVIGNGWGYR
ncbi:cupin domain-containing protein [Paenibacillus spongiae]|uniref:Cupin domain-containing protein n=1 Tax=Paenibacillus spongiae TaxID=2909671 RepID=A0ABY5S3C1_9BACL|nr:cupin domain-containing protein [Paenibacillus spongiae]UVI28387.1 cupin domain-containing protein [Paenibacillus spongiae]